MFWDDGSESNAYVTTNDQSQSRFRFKGSAKINADWSAGFLMEFGFSQTADGDKNDADGNVPGSFGVRHEALYLKSNSMGTIWLGHTTIAMYGIADIVLGGTTNNSVEQDLSFGGFIPFLTGTTNAYAGATLSALGAGGNPANGVSRRDLIKYVSPTVGGFVLSADAGGDDQWTAALRYAGEFGGIRVAGGVGYGQDTELDAGAVVGQERIDTFGASLSAQHVPTGLFIAGSYGESDNNSTALSQETTTRSVTAGMGQKFSTLGTTTFWGRYTQNEGGYVEDGFTAGVAVSSSDFVVISAGINQSIDAAAMDLYVTYYNVTGDVTSNSVKYDMKDFNAVMAGAIIRF
jgi:predicted porin